MKRILCKGDIQGLICSFFPILSSARRISRRKQIIRNPSSFTKIRLGLSLLWCAMRDLNPHGHPLDPKSSASANSANRASVKRSPALPKKNPENKKDGDSTGNRTRVTAVKGRCLDRLTMEPHKKLITGDALLSQAAARQVSSAQRSLTTVFEMGTGGASPL